MNKIYYHGTSTTFNLYIGDLILPPIYTGTLREDYRDYNLDVVYVTDNFYSAYKYAEKAVKKYSGEPIVYKVQPDEYSLCWRRADEYITNQARIVDVECKG